ncbi:Uncharacterized protein Adt_23690 [Abeliophyllum distichum]|uniref:Reverse transcriptase/retrotransposon-derived protein RNase H-like domain-containing protein n=1 Tax=Abeliophyllum distichum TaxID=126358 RepID=A0ABD1SBU2_9LAMI
MFDILCKCQIKLNSLKCAFGVESGKCLGYMVNQHMIEAHLKKIRELIDMCSPSSPKKVQSFMERPSIKGQALANFIVELAYIMEGLFKVKPQEVPTWKLYIDGSLGDAKAEAEILLISSEGYNLNCALHLEFKVSNNAFEYETLLRA